VGPHTLGDGDDAAGDAEIQEHVHVNDADFDVVRGERQKEVGAIELTPVDGERLLVVLVGRTGWGFFVPDGAIDNISAIVGDEPSVGQAQHNIIGRHLSLPDGKIGGDLGG
jgi:hypothetical protein